MPLPLYGSGGRRRRMSAATCPTDCLSMPRTMICVGAGISNSMPAGGSTTIGCEKPSSSSIDEPAQRGAIADALDLEALLVAVRDALDHVRDERAREAVQRAVRAAVRRARDRDDALVDAHRHLVRDGLLERPSGALHAHASRTDVDLDAGGQGDGGSSDSAHCRATRRSRALRRQCRALRPDGW